MFDKEDKAEEDKEKNDDENNQDKNDKLRDINKITNTTMSFLHQKMLEVYALH